MYWHCLCATAEGHIGVVPISSEAGDSVVHIEGIDILLALRKVSDSEYILIGDCLFLGLDPEDFMQMESEKYESTTII